MISPLEVLEKSRYHFDLQQKAPQLLNQRLDVSFARYQSNYAIAEIGMICSTCQLWVNYCFPIIYTLKGLQKVSGGDEKVLLQSAIVKHRYLSYALIRSLAYALALVDDATMQRWESHHPGVDDSADLHATARYLYQTGSLEKAILVVLNHYVEHAQNLMDQVHTHVHLLSPKKRPLWIKAYEQWRNTPLADIARLRTA